MCLILTKMALLLVLWTATARTGRHEGRTFFISSCKKAFLSQRYHRKLRKAVMWFGLTELVCLTGCLLILAHPWLQGISRDFSSSTDFRIWPNYRGFRLWGLCPDGLMQVLSVLLERLEQKHCDMGTWFPLWVKCEFLSLERMPQYYQFLAYSGSNHSTIKTHFEVCRFPALQQMSPQSTHTV